MQDNTSYISYVSTYPKETIEYKKFLYFGDSCGIIRFFDLNPFSKNKFKEIHRIETNTGKAILSAMAFSDDYNEIADLSKIKEKNENLLNLQST